MSLLWFAEPKICLVFSGRKLIQYFPTLSSEEKELLVGFINSHNTNPNPTKNNHSLPLHHGNKSVCEWLIIFSSESSDSLLFQMVAWFSIWQEALDMLWHRLQRDFNYLRACLEAYSHLILHRARRNRWRQREKVECLLGLPWCLSVPRKHTAYS